LDVYSTEDEQVEAIKKWWNENGKSAVFGVVLGLGAIFGWRTWQAHIIAQAESASEIYQSALISAGQDNRDQARGQAMDVITNYSDTGYVVMARMVLAYIETLDSNYDEAEEQLRLALDVAENETIKQEINLRLARVYITNNKLSQAMSVLETTPPESFSSQYHELKGDVYAQQGDIENAKQSYQQAIEDAQSTAFDTSLLNLKINSLETM
jgi:predicted negative regulator of RcsB-dependent stress response